MKNKEYIEKHKLDPIIQKYQNLQNEKQYWYNRIFQEGSVDEKYDANTSYDLIKEKLEKFLESEYIDFNFKSLLEEATVLTQYCEYIDQTVIPETESIAWSDRKTSPKAAGIYLIFREGELVYIGETSNIYDRLTHHENGNGSALKEKIADASGLEPVEYLRGCTLKLIPVMLGRLEVEKFLIGKYNPIFNNYKLRKRYA